ncbi:MAG: hypothetical protein ACOYU3_01140 [Bacillota bacterium]
MKRKLGIVTLVLTAVFLLAACNQQAATSQTSSPASTAKMTVTKADGTKTDVTMDTLTDMGIAKFTTKQATSKTGPEENAHKGVLLKELLQKIGVNTDKITDILVTSTDGFSSVYSKAQLDDPDKLYLTYEMDCETLKDEGGKDVFYIIAKNEEFKQNWTKYVESIKIR